MTKLIVAGCSVSDYTQVDNVWGEILAESLNYDYIHEAAGCGSNYRMWRVLTNYILTGKITAKDTVIVQYTTVERNEFWSPIIQDDWKRELCYDGNILRFKSGSHTWHTGAENKLMKTYEKFISTEFETEKFINNHMMFQCLAKEYGIKNLYFLKVGSYAIDNIPFIDFYRDNYIHYNKLTIEKYHLKNDNGHLSMLGHEDLAKYVMEILQ